MTIQLSIILIFILGYVSISMEHKLKIDKLIPALLMMSLSWTFVSLNLDSLNKWFSPVLGEFKSLIGMTHKLKVQLLQETLLHHFGKTAEILIFLMGAMIIVEMIDHFDGFSSIKTLIKTKRKMKLLWVVCGLSFLLSAIIDNLTATIVLITILRKLVSEQEDRMWFAGFIIIAANAGGAWTPIGDVTTTMLWMANKVSTGKLMQFLVLPSLINVLIPLLIASRLKVFKGETSVQEESSNQGRFSRFMLILGLSLVVFVPVFKTVTHLPPYLGMMLSLSLFAIVAEILSKRMLKFTYGGADDEVHASGPTLKALTKIEMPSVLFFLGILMTVAAMESIGIIYSFGESVNSIMSQKVFVVLIGFFSAIIDNVPLVAASLGMFDEALDSNVWHFIAYSAGTGGSMLIIGSAAGVVAMGMEKISFSWYFKNITLLAIIGYLAGISALLLLS